MMGGPVKITPTEAAERISRQLGQEITAADVLAAIHSGAVDTEPDKTGRVRWINTHMLRHFYEFFRDGIRMSPTVDEIWGPPLETSLTKQALDNRPPGVRSSHDITRVATKIYSVRTQVGKSAAGQTGSIFGFRIESY